MKIKRFIDQHGRDFSAVMECEHCGETQSLRTGYDDANYHDNVIPAMKCSQCGMARNDKAAPLVATLLSQHRNNKKV